VKRVGLFGGGAPTPTRSPSRERKNEVSTEAEKGEPHPLLGNHPADTGKAVLYFKTKNRYTMGSSPPGRRPKCAVSYHYWVENTLSTLSK
jgi:hypothetical protein